MTFVFCNKKKGKWIPVAACEQTCKHKKRCVDYESNNYIQTLNLKRAEMRVCAALLQ